MQRRTDLLDGRSKRLLHFAPANALRARLRRIPNLQYVTGDLASADLALRLDITQLPFSDGAFDAVYCSHVLEHVEQDRRALAEIARVLRPGGWALLLVPIEGATTHEDPSIDTPRGRLRAFGQEDHVRLYGRDFTERVAATGLVVEAVPYGAELGADAASEMGLAQDEIIHFCRKPAG